MPGLARILSRAQASQLSVQALTRFCSVYLFVLASWADPQRLPLIALQGALLALPYTLIEAAVGRPLAADVVPGRWDLEAWARRVAMALVLPVGLVAYLSASVALVGSSPVDRLLMIAPVLLQLPVEGLFWVTNRTRSRRRANLIPQLTAVGTLLTGAVFAASDVRLDIAAVPAQLAVLGWVLLSGRARGRPAGAETPGVRHSLRIGQVYSLTALIDLSYSVALPSVAGAVVGQGAVVVLRALELAFGPFHIALSATARDDLVAGRKSQWRTATRALTVAALLAVSAAVIASDRVRDLLAADGTQLTIAAVATYCGYKALVMVSTWLSVRHMIWVTPRQFLISAVGSRVVALGGLLIALGLVSQVSQLFLQLLVCEALVVAWFSYRIRRTVSSAARPASSGTAAPAAAPADTAPAAAPANASTAGTGTEPSGRCNTVV